MRTATTTTKAEISSGGRARNVSSKPSTASQIGNQAFARALSFGRFASVQAKLRVGPVDDPMEREADRIADAVLSTRSVSPTGVAATPRAQRMCASCQEEEEDALVQRKSTPVSVVNHGTQTLSARLPVGSGTPLAPNVREFFEDRFHRDFSHVRVHTGTSAAQSARDLQARAYTWQNHIVFAGGEYAPGSREGQRLLAHELTHVVQQGAGANPLHDSCVASHAGDVFVQRQVANEQSGENRHEEINTSATTCNAVPNCTPAMRRADRAACESAFTSAHRRASVICNTALMRLQSHSLPPTTRARVTNYAGVTSMREVNDLVLQVRRSLSRIERRIEAPSESGGHICEDRCSLTCSTIAAGSMSGVRLCYGFYSGDVTPDQRPWVLIHEAAHGTGEFTDVRYLHQLGFDQLSQEERQFNADSITRLIVELGDTSRRTWYARQRSPIVQVPASMDRRARLRLVFALGEVQRALNLSAFDQGYYLDYICVASGTGMWPCVDDMASNSANIRIAVAAVRDRFEIVGPPSPVIADPCTLPSAGPPPSVGERSRLEAIVNEIRAMKGIARRVSSIVQEEVGAPVWRRHGTTWTIAVPRRFTANRTPEEIASEILHALVLLRRRVAPSRARDLTDIVFWSSTSRTTNLPELREEREQRRSRDPNWGISSATR